MNISEQNLLQLAKKLKKEYQQVRHYQQDPPASAISKTVLGVLVVTILSQASNDVRTKKIYCELKERYSTWEQLADADPDEVVDVLRAGGLARQKTRYLQSVLSHVHCDFGDYSLETLSDWDNDKCYQYLTDLPGVGPKTAACVLLFGLNRDVFPVDTHVARISTRLGLVDASDSAEKIQKILSEYIPGGWSLSLHLNMLEHGRTICKARNPDCVNCSVSDVCQFRNSNNDDN